MLKIAALVSLFMIGTLWAAGMSCDSCGDECATACGTRQFRACCFNYLRRKRTSGSNAISSKYWPPKFREIKPEELRKISKKTPIFTIENIPDRYVERTPNDFDTYLLDETMDNRMSNFDF